MDNGTFSPADYAAMSGNKDGFGGGAAWIWFFAIIILFMFFGNGNNNQQNMTDAVIAGQGGYVTNSQMNDAIQFNSLQQGNRDVIGAVEQSKYDTANTLAAIEQRIAGQESSILQLGNTIAEKQNTCCQEALRGIDGVNYNAAMNTASINQNTTAQTQKILDAIQQNKIESLQSKVNELEMKNQMAGVVRYPMNTMYGVPSPCFGCGCGNV